MAIDVSVDRGAPRGAAFVPRNLNLALIVVALAQLMVVLDATIVNIALPSVQRALHLSLIHI